MFNLNDVVVYCPWHLMNQATTKLVWACTWVFAVMEESQFVEKGALVLVVGAPHIFGFSEPLRQRCTQCSNRLQYAWNLDISRASQHVCVFVQPWRKDPDL
jgi:hypothetical protein